MAAGPGEGATSPPEEDQSQETACSLTVPEWKAIADLEEQHDEEVLEAAEDVPEWKAIAEDPSLEVEEAVPEAAAAVPEAAAAAAEISGGEEAIKVVLEGKFNADSEAGVADEAVPECKIIEEETAVAEAVPETAAAEAVPVTAAAEAVPEAAAAEAVPETAAAEAVPETAAAEAVPEEVVVAVSEDVVAEQPPTEEVIVAVTEEEVSATSKVLEDNTGRLKIMTTVHRKYFVSFLFTTFYCLF